MKAKVLITGGQGDLASKLAGELASQYTVHTPGRDQLNVVDPVSVEQYFATHHFDVVINNAGTLYSSLIKDSDPIAWINDINVNLIGTYLVCRQAIRQNASAMLINVASTAAYNAYKDWSSYCAAKAGVLKISTALADDGYDVYCLCPGAIETKLRNGLEINNPNVMTLEEGVQPFLSVLNGDYQSGDIIFYRKNQLIVNPTVNHT